MLISIIDVTLAVMYVIFLKEGENVVMVFMLSSDSLFSVSGDGIKLATRCFACLNCEASEAHILSVFVSYFAHGVSSLQLPTLYTRCVL